MKRAPLLSAITTAMLLTLISCADLPTNVRVEIKDKLLYVDEGPLGAHRYHTENNLTKNIPFDVWNALDGNPDARFGMTCMNNATLGQFKKELELVCSFYGNCDHPDVVQVREFLKRAQRKGAKAIQQTLSTEE